MTNTELTTIKPEVIDEPCQYQQSVTELFNGYQQDGATVNEELSVCKMSFDIHGNASDIPGDIHRHNTEEHVYFQGDRNSAQTSIKSEPLSDQSHPFIFGVHDKVAYGTAIETEATVSKLTVKTNRDYLFAADNIKMLKSEDIHHKDCSILMSVNEEYCEKMPVLDIKQENKNVAHAIASNKIDVKSPTSNCEMTDVTTEIYPPILDSLQIKIKNNNPQFLINHDQSRQNITTCVREMPHPWSTMLQKFFLA